MRHIIIPGYAVLYTTNKTRDSDEWTAMQVGGEDLSTRLNSVKPEQTYYFKVQARNRKGYGPFSNIVAFTTSAAGKKWQILVHENIYQVLINWWNWFPLGLKGELALKIKSMDN